MKKSLLAVAFASACCMMANAEKVAIIVENEPYEGTANEIATIHVGDEDPTIYTNAFTWEWYPSTETSAPSAQVNGSFHWYAKTAAKLTAAPGVTITKIEVTTPYAMGTKGAGPAEYTWTIPFNPEFTVSDEMMTWTGSIAPGQSMTMQPTAQSRFTVIEVTYTGKPELPLMPVAEPESTVIARQKPVELSTDEPGAQIYYTLDGSYADANSILYTGPIYLSPGTNEINAVTVKNGKTSPQSLNTFLVTEAGMNVVKYDFRSIDELTIPNKEWPAKASSSAYNIYLVDAELKNEDVTIEVLQNESTSKPRMSLSTNGMYVEMRAYNGNSLLFSVPEAHYIGSILVAGSNLFGEKGKLGLAAGQTGTVEYGGYKAYVSWKAQEGIRESVVELAFEGSTTYYADNIYVAYAPMTNSGIDAIEVDNSNAPVVYYNLQGMQVAADNLTPGIYIKRQGTKAEKIYVK